MKTTITKNLLKTLLLSVILIIQCRTVVGQWSTDPDVNNAISNFANDDVEPKIGFCSDGSLYIAYLQLIDFNYNVRLQKLDSQGNELWAQNGILISDHTTDTWMAGWDMAVDVADHAILTFTDKRGGGENWQAHAYRISPSGAFVWGPDGIQISAIAEHATAPIVECTPAGNAVFAWMANDGDIKMQKMNPAGVKQWGDDGITISDTYQLWWPQLLPAGTDDILLKYFSVQGPTPTSPRHILLQKYNSAGVPVWSAPTVVSNAGGLTLQDKLISMIGDGNGGCYIAWHDGRVLPLASSYVQHVNSSGSALFTANGLPLSTFDMADHAYPQLALPAGSSEVFVFWNEMTNMQDLKGIYGQKVSSDGQRLWGDYGMPFIEVTADNVVPLAVSCAGNNMMVMYSFGVQRIKGMLIGPDGGFIWTPSSTEISNVPSPKISLTMSEFNSQWVVCWEDFRNENFDIYAQNVLPDGTLGPNELVFGNIEGHVTLTDGTGDVTDVLVSAGNYSTHPDSNGDYFLEAIASTQTVTASLAGYATGIVNGVVVLENQTTSNVDFELSLLLTYGWIEGTVELFNGNGDVSQTVISAGGVTTNPDVTGYYFMEVGVGTWDVTATLDGYTQQLHADVYVGPGQTVSDIDFLLSLIPTTGFLYGTVTIEGNMADVMQAVIDFGLNTLTPDSEGDYLIELPVGSHVVNVGHQYTSSVSATVTIEPGGSTGQDFFLTMLRRDLVITCQDQSGNTLNGATIEVTGPEGDYSGIVENNSIVFQDVPFGTYTGESVFGYSQVFSDTIIDITNNRMEFVHIITGTSGDLFNTLSIFPNPVGYNQSINLGSDMVSNGKLLVCDVYGRKLAEINVMTENMHNLPVSSIFQGTKINAGLYIFHFITNTNRYSTKVLITD